MINKRYQVFVSSTFQDLQTERQEIIQALLELDCIPAGMELFPAANDDQWTLIKRVIDDCDYYMVIIGGRYGSLGPAGASYTEMEYRYACEKQKPVIAFLHRNPGSLPADRCESSPEGREKLLQFRNTAQQKMVKFWETPADLGSVVSRSIILLMRSTPAVGWVRADALPDENMTEELLRLRSRVAELQETIESLNKSAPLDSEHLAQGSDHIPIHYHPDTHWDRKIPTKSLLLSWDAIFAAVAPGMIDEASDSEVKSSVEALIANSMPLTIGTSGPKKAECLVSGSSFSEVIVQLRALGHITKSVRKRAMRDNYTYWTLTPYGDDQMTRLMAIRKPDSGQT